MRAVALPLLVTLLSLDAVAQDPPSDRAAVINGNTSFAIDLYRRQASRRGNIFFSPSSISTAMAMAGIGARAETAAEIEKTMRWPFGGKRLAEAWSSVLDDVNRGAGTNELLTANAMWAARNVTFLEAYETTVQKEFRGKLERLDFAGATEQSRARINGWVSETTRQKIRDLIAAGMITAETKLVLTNAIYMNAKWASEFPKDATQEKGLFHTPNGEIRTPMMRMLGTFAFYKGDGVRVLELPYRGEGLSMIVVLPDARDGLSAVEQALTGKQLAAWEQSLQPTRVDVTFPRFSTEMTLDLGKTLAEMGIRRAFEADRADFSGMTGGRDLFISKVVHKARVDVTEAGTEAAAATAVMMRVTSARPGVAPPPPERFHADHPFFFYIRRNGSNSVLFAGRVEKP